jgi:hypothetical protein
MQAINFDQNCAPHWGRVQCKHQPFAICLHVMCCTNQCLIALCAIPKGKSNFSHFAVARSVIGHWLVQLNVIAMCALPGYASTPLTITLHASQMRRAILIEIDRLREASKRLGS